MYKEDSIDSRIIFNSFFRYKWHVLIILLSILLGTFFYIKHLTPIYASNILISIDKDQKSQMTSLFPNSNVINIDTESQLNYETSILKSHAIILDVLKKVDLSQRFFIQGLWRDRELYNKEIPFRLTFKKYPETKRSSFKFKIEEIDNKHFVLNPKRDINKNLYRYGEKIKKENYEIIIEKKKPNDSLLGKKFIIIKEMNRDVLISNILDNLSIKKEMDRLLSINYEDPIPTRAKDIATQLILSYEKYNLKNRQLQDVNNIHFFDKTILEIKNRLKTIKNKLGKYQSKHQELLLLGSEDRFFFNIIEKKSEIMDLSLKLNALEKTKERIAKGIYSISLLENNDLKVTDLQQLIKQLREKSNKLTLLHQQQNDITTPLIKDLSYTELLIKLNIAHKKLEELKIEFTSEYSKVKRTQEDILILTKELKTYLRNHITNYSLEIKALTKKTQRIISSLITSIKKKYTALKKSLNKDTITINKLPKSSMKLEELKREFELNENNHKKLLQKRGEAVISKASTMSNIHVINSATISQTPLKPKKNFIYLSGLILGIVLSILYTSIKRGREKTIYSKDDIKLNDYSLIYNNTNIYEDNFLPLITKLEQLKSLNRAKIILISSDDYNENKSTTTIKLASALSNISKKVFVIDFDIYHSRLSNKFNQTPNMGLSTLFTSKHSFEEINMKEYLSNIQQKNRAINLLPTGPILPNGSELLFNPKNGILLEKLSKEYDYILMDTPPLGKYPEIAILLKYVDVFLVTAIIQKTNKEFFEKLKDIQEENIEKIIFLSKQKK